MILKIPRATTTLLTALHLQKQAELILNRVEMAFWFEGLEWSSGCTASDKNRPLDSSPLYSSLALRPYCLTEVGQGVLLSRLR